MFHVKSKFISNYCRTCHSIQGSSLDSSITIFDYRFEHASREWLDVAITRATDLSQVYVYDYKEDKDLYDNFINSYF